MNKPYAESCEQNRGPILTVIKPLLENCSSVLEIGSGTGQHAVYFAQQMPHLVWHPSDCAHYLPGINLWLDDAGLDNVRRPVELDVSRSSWPRVHVDAVFSANTVHIMRWPDVEALFGGVGEILFQGGKFLLYGPFNYGGAYTSPSNENFDRWLKNRDPDSGVRDFEELDRLARQAGMCLAGDIEMPANNRILHWRKA
jgi:cyclopropane fatty-acyl-phospholipid synthase-like methyltransferase